MRPHHDSPFDNRATERWPQARDRQAGGDDDLYGYVVHLPIAVANGEAAVETGRALVAMLRCLPVVEVGSASLSAEGRPDRHQALCCNRRLGDTGRCLLPPRHAGDCGDTS